MPGVDRPVTVITNPLFEIIAIIVSVAVFVERPATVKVVPETQFALFTALAFASKAGPEPIARLVSTVEVELVPELVDNPLHSVPHVPTVVAFVKKV